MMHDVTDEELLRLAGSGSREALGEIARRYAGFVYHSALRNLRDPHLAADVTQAVFVILSSKLQRLKRGTILHAWLFNTTRFTAANARKLRARRTHHEHNAAAMRHEMIQHDVAADSDASRDAVSPLLDEALGELREIDRAAVLLSYFGGKTFAQVGAAIGKSEEAARKRVDRAIARMRAFFARRGIEVGTAGLIVAMRTAAEATVPQQVTCAINAGLLSTSSGGTGTAAAAELAQRVTRMMQWMRIKLTAAACATVAAMGIVGAGLTMSNAGPPRATPAQQPTAPAASAPDAVSPMSVQLGQDVRVTLVGLSTLPAQNAWWDAHARPVQAPWDDGAALPNAAHQAAVRVETPPDSTVAIRVGPCAMQHNDLATRGGEPIPGLYRIEFQPNDGQATIGVYVRIGSEPYETLLDSENPAAGAEGETPDGQITLEPLSDDGQGRTRAVLSHALPDHDVIVRVTDAGGRQHEPIMQRTGSEGDAHELIVVFDVPPDGVKRLQMQARSLDKWVHFENITLDPARKTDVDIRCGTDPTTQPGR
jgi:RNA polymerase sigma factor (sigma-70 family)